MQPTPTDIGVKQFKNFRKIEIDLLNRLVKNVFSIDEDEKIFGYFNEILGVNEFYPSSLDVDDIILITERTIISSLKQLKKQKKINEKLYQTLRTTGLQLRRPYLLAGVRKNGTPFRTSVETR